MGQELQEHLGHKKEWAFSILAPQMGWLPPSLSTVWSRVTKSFGSFNKSLLSTYYVPGTMHTNTKTNTPICPQGAPLIWQLPPVLCQLSTPALCAAGPRDLTDTLDSWTLFRCAPEAWPACPVQESKGRASGFLRKPQYLSARANQPEASLTVPQLLN